MTPELNQRCANALLLALALAVACGLMALPAFDLLDPLRQGPVAGGLLAALLHGALAWLGLSLALHRCGWARGPAHASSLAALLRLSLVGAALTWWLLSLLIEPRADARALLWLQTLPLWCALAGIGRRERRPGRTRMGAGIPKLPAVSQRHQQAVKHLGAVQHLHMRGAGDVPGARTGQARVGGGEHDVVAMAVAAQEQPRP